MNEGNCFIDYRVTLLFRRRVKGEFENTHENEMRDGKGQYKGRRFAGILLQQRIGQIAQDETPRHECRHQ